MGVCKGVFVDERTSNQDRRCRNIPRPWDYSAGDEQRFQARAELFGIRPVAQVVEDGDALAIGVGRVRQMPLALGNGRQQLVAHADASA